MVQITQSMSHLRSCWAFFSFFSFILSLTTRTSAFFLRLRDDYIFPSIIASLEGLVLFKTVFLQATSRISFWILLLWMRVSISLLARVTCSQMRPDVHGVIILFRPFPMRFLLLNKDDSVHVRGIAAVCSPRNSEARSGYTCARTICLASTLISRLDKWLISAVMAWKRRDRLSKWGGGQRYRKGLEKCSDALAQCMLEPGTNWSDTDPMICGIDTEMNTNCTYGYDITANLCEC